MSVRGTKKPNASKWIRFRIVLVGSIFALCFGVIVGRAVQLQVLDGNDLAEKAATQYNKAYYERPRRGTIFDQNRKELAISIDVPSVCAYPKRIRSPQQTAVALARALRLKQRPIFRKLISGKKFVWVKRYASSNEVSALRELNLEGVGFPTESRRFYPMKTLAAQAIGFCGTEETGLEGLEYYYDRTLSGLNSTRTGIRDALGRWFSPGGLPPENKDGLNLILTIDSNIQNIAEQAVSESVEQFSAKSGMALVMVPSTGAILAMAHVPQFNPNTFGRYEPWIWRNRAITDSFEPGSTFKIFLAAAALESDTCTPDSIFYCENGKYLVGKNVIHDIHAYGDLSFRDIIKYSSNIGAAKIGEKIGSGYLYDKLKAFGFGTKTNIGWPYERSGRLHPVRLWSEMDALATCFGHGVSVSALQLTAGVAALANDGLLMKPYLVQEITNPQGQRVWSVQPTITRRVVSFETAQSLTSMLERVVAKSGTGVKAAVRGYRIAGKTGTAQKIDPNGNGYLKDKHTAAFVGFAPSRDPKMVILVVIDEPQRQYYGGVVAAPVFRRIAMETLQYLKIPPELVTPDEEAKPLRASREAVHMG